MAKRKTRKIVHHRRRVRRHHRRRIGAINKNAVEAIAGVAVGALGGGFLLKLVPDTSASGKDNRFLKGLGAFGLGAALSTFDGALMQGVGLGLAAAGVNKLGQKFGLISDNLSAVGYLPGNSAVGQLPAGQPSKAQRAMAVGMMAPMY